MCVCVCVCVCARACVSVSVCVCVCVCVQVQLKGSLQELLSERRQLHRDMESTRSKCIRFESIARRLKEQNEVLCERVREIERGRERERERERG